MEEDERSLHLSHVFAQPIRISEGQLTAWQCFKLLQEIPHKQTARELPPVPSRGDSPCLMFLVCLC